MTVDMIVNRISEKKKVVRNFCNMYQSSFFRALICCKILKRSDKWTVRIPHPGLKKGWISACSN